MWQTMVSESKCCLQVRIDAEGAFFFTMYTVVSHLHSVLRNLDFVLRTHHNPSHAAPAAWVLILRDSVDSYIVLRTMYTMEIDRILDLLFERCTSLV